LKLVQLQHTMTDIQFLFLVIYAIFEVLTAVTAYYLLLGAKRTVRYISDENSEVPAAYTLFETMNFTLLTPLSLLS
jgi:hypothetical protein